MSEQTPLQTPNQLAAMQAHVASDPRMTEWSTPTMHVSESLRQDMVEKNKAFDRLAAIGGKAVEFVDGIATIGAASALITEVPKFDKAVTDVVASASPQAEAKESLSREERLFAINPKVAGTEPEKAEEFDFRHLFTATDEELDAEAADYIANGAQKNSVESPRDRVTDDGDAAARSAVRNAMSIDRNFHDLINDHPSVKANNTRGAGAKPLPELLRTDASLRLAAGSYLLDKLEHHLHPSAMPRRVRLNTPKASAVTGYEAAKDSEEYTAMLALSMLDGTFDPSRETTGDNTYSPVTDEGTGQHRYAARQLLNGRGDYER